MFDFVHYLLIIMVVIFVTEPPSAPQNLTVNFVDQSTVILSWNTPSFLGGRLDVVYRVECDACGPSVVYSPNTVCLIVFKFNYIFSKAL